MVSHWESLCTPECCAAIERGSGECRRLGAKSWINVHGESALALAGEIASGKAA
ncbi:MAG: hypothetical protein ACHQ6T_19410 [Myxococcota bacterium]